MAELAKARSMQPSAYSVGGVRKPSLEIPLSLSVQDKHTADVDDCVFAIETSL